MDLRGHCADGVARRQGVPQQKAGHCLPLPAADDVQRLAGLTGNSLYSYGALVQSTLLPALVAGLAVLRWQDTGHKRWAVLAGYCMFQCCATFEIGFTYIVPIFGLAWLYTDKARDALRLSIPALLGECVTLAFNMGARLMNTLRAAGILEGSVSQIEGISRTLTCLPSCAPGPCRCRRASH